jgi:hypothetical protein
MYFTTFFFVAVIVNCIVEKRFFASTVVDYQVFILSQQKNGSILPKAHNESCLWFTDSIELYLPKHNHSHKEKEKAQKHKNSCLI